MFNYAGWPMPRRARLVIPGIPRHIIQRGNDSSACFYDSGDHARYLDILSKQAAKHYCLIHAWCLMTNHVHLLLTPASRSQYPFPVYPGLPRRGCPTRHRKVCSTCSRNRSLPKGVPVWTVALISLTSAGSMACRKSLQQANCLA